MTASLIGDYLLDLFEQCVLVRWWQEQQEAAEQHCAEAQQALESQAVEEDAKAALVDDLNDATRNQKKISTKAGKAKERLDLLYMEAEHEGVAPELLKAVADRYLPLKEVTS